MRQQVERRRLPPASGFRDERQVVLEAMGTEGAERDSRRAQQPCGDQTTGHQAFGSVSAPDFFCVKTRPFSPTETMTGSSLL